jgi:hypothetical protein
MNKDLNFPLTSWPTKRLIQSNNRKLNCSFAVLSVFTCQSTYQTLSKGYYDLQLNKTTNLSHVIYHG